MTRRLHILSESETWQLESTVMSIKYHGIYANSCNFLVQLLQIPVLPNSSELIIWSLPHGETIPFFDASSEEAHNISKLLFRN